MYYKTTYIWLFVITFGMCRTQSGPDPWNFNYVDSNMNNEPDLPPDIRNPLKRINFSERSNNGIGEWSFKRTLAILMKGGQIKRSDDGSIDVSVQMKFYQEQWDTLDGYLKSDTSFTEDMFRRALGYIEEALYKPSIVDNIVTSWSENVQEFLVNYKMHITWTLGALSALAAIVWLWRHTSHLVIVLFTLLYFYEVYVSYKEVEQQELLTFLNAVQTCKWYFWKSSCEVPKPDLLIFLKHMNPMKIAIRMISSLITEPIMTVSGTVKILIEGLTDGLWFPFDKIVYGILIAFIHVILILFFIMILFNYILNIPFNLSLLGLFSIGVQQRNKTIFSPYISEDRTNAANVDRIGGATLDKILDVCNRALDNASQSRSSRGIENVLPQAIPKIKRSASTGRLPNANSSFDNATNYFALEHNVLRKRNSGKHRGGGDAV